ncbi:trypsin-like peptidase domain-containing protein [Rhodovarius lipocyclicus]|uniref:trypsin-like peptidase domain-containing protein n=1 Tax=Rhodovarius lipocyclicus TaxID=268410 RepID=UPI001F402B51|nr:trypsin-like peptidase domain-containing protein [Rhodovarius lipocyclicus]
MIELEQRAKSLSQFVSEPDRARKKLDERVEFGLELERRRPAFDAAVQSQVVGRFPVPLQSLFQDREAETKALCDFFRAPSGRIALVSGRGGIGKSAMVCRVLDGMIRGNLPDDNGSFSVSAAILLSFKTARLPTADGLRNGLLDIAAEADRARISNLLGARDWSEARLHEVFETFSVHRYPKGIIILMDNMEDGIETSTLGFVDQDLSRFLSVLAHIDVSAIKVVMTSRLRPSSLQHLNPAVFADLPFHEGLPTPFAENFLRALDPTGAFGLRDAMDTQLTALREHTRGFPRAIEAVWMQITAGASVDEILSRQLADDRVVEALVGEALRRLPDIDQLIICTLAVFGRPVPPTAIDFVLRAWFDHIDSAAVLPRLVNMRFVQRQRQSHALHPVDAANALRVLQSRDWPTGRRASHDAFGAPVPQPLTLRAMKILAADYLRSIGRPRRDWKTISDIDEYVAQFGIRIDVGDDFSAARILDEIKDFAQRQGSFRLILELADQLETIAKGSFAKQVALRGAAASLWRVGRVKEAASRQKQLIALLENELGDVSFELANLAIYEFGDGRYRDALQIFQRLNDRHSIDAIPNKNAEILHHWMSDCHSQLGYLDKALELQRRALQIAESHRDSDSIEAQTHNLASIYDQLRKTSLAKQLGLNALKMAEATGNPLWKANHLSLLNRICYRLGDESSAKRYNDAEAVIRHEIGDLDGLAYATLREGERQFLRGDSAGATASAMRALAQEASDARIMRRAKAILTRAALDQEKWFEAEQHLAEILEVTTDAATYDYHAMLGCCRLGLEQDEQARAAFEKAAAEAHEWIARCGANQDAHSKLGWALAGLYALGLQTQTDAISSFGRARELSSEPEDVALRLRDIDLLARCKPAALFGPILEAVDGKSRRPPNDAGGAVMPTEADGLGGQSARSHKDREELVALLARRARHAPRGEFLNNLLLAARLSDRWLSELQGLIRGNPENDSRALVRALLDFGDNPADGNGALASLLLPLLPALGATHAATVGSILLSYDLVRSPDAREELVGRFQFPCRLDSSFARNTNNDPGFATAPPGDEIILQGWLARDPEYLDVGLLRKAVERARSVCRIELPALRSSGTGVLVGDDLILTNYHVLAPGGSSPDANAAGAIVRFGVFSDADAQPGEGQVLRLHANAVVARSSTDKLDFVLLRTTKPAVELVDIMRLDIGGDEPQFRGDLHILQHPQGGTMKLALSVNSVVSINQANSRVQYATRTSGGSSGSPCFNADWQLVALHHAEIARPFGAVREGVLMTAIRDEIRTQLG